MLHRASSDTTRRGIGLWHPSSQGKADAVITRIEENPKGDRSLDLSPKDFPWWDIPKDPMSKATDARQNWCPPKASKQALDGNLEVKTAMTTYAKTVTFGPTSGGKAITSDKVEPLINGILARIQDEGGKILDVKVALAPATPGNHVSVYLITYDASQPID